MDPFAPLVAFLRFQRHGGDGTGVQPFQADRFARHLAIAVFAGLDPAQGRVDLADQLALAVAGAQFQRTVGFLAGAVGDVGNIAGAVLQTLQRFGGLIQQFLLPGFQLAPEIFQLPVVHERLILGGTIVLGQEGLGFHKSSPAAPGWNGNRHLARPLKV